MTEEQKDAEELEKLHNEGYFDEQIYEDHEHLFDDSEDYYGEDEEEHSCLYGDEYCAYESAKYLIKELTNAFWKRLRNRFSKKQKEELEELYMSLGSFAASEYCNFVCPMRITGGE